MELGIARTGGRYKDYPEVTEIETVTLHLIRNAERTLYIENQYLASRRIAEAIADRLREQGGPEVVMVMPETADGWLEAKAMDSARARLLYLLREADRHNRLHAYYPLNEAGTSISIHAKVMIVDDRFLKIGSANLNNRSMGYDTEYDVVIDAHFSADPESVSSAIAQRRAMLLGEHFGIEQEVVNRSTAEQGGRLAA